MSRIARRGALPAVLVAAFAAAFFGLGAVSRSTPTAAGITQAAQVPYAPWYWTMVVSPRDPDVLVLGTNSGVFRSSDGAQTWRPSGLANVNVTSLVQAGSTMFAGGVRGPNPIVRKGAGRTAPDGPAVLAASTDEGKTWRTLRPRGLPNRTVQALAVDPAGGSALYALLNDGGLYRSTDGARSFRTVSPKIGAPPWALAIADGGRFVAGDMDRGGFTSADGRAWRRTPFTDSRGGRMVMEYSVDPADLTRVVMSSVGIELSTDAGRTWRLALRSKVMFGPVAWAPGSPGVAYAVGFDRSFWRSDDRGETWRQIS
ncbi:MAG TPA: hypothetical protein VFB42_14680 [Gaiellaceae bacterium]|nr:hypothetical protein [Gaiellaceae bacterium]